MKKYSLLYGLEMTSVTVCPKAGFFKFLQHGKGFSYFGCCLFNAHMFSDFSTHRVGLIKYNGIA
jgi:hypothetical protein